MIVHYNPALYHQGSDRGWGAQQQSHEGIFRAGVDRVAKIEERNVGTLSRFKTADVRSTQALRAAHGRHV